MSIPVCNCDKPMKLDLTYHVTNAKVSVAVEWYCADDEESCYVEPIPYTGEFDELSGEHKGILRFVAKCIDQKLPADL